MKEIFFLFVFLLLSYSGFTFGDDNLLKRDFLSQESAETDTLFVGSEVSDYSVIFGVRTNVLSWMTLAPQGEFDIFWGDHYNASLGGGYGWWGFNGDKKALQTWKASSEFRYYFVPIYYLWQCMCFRV